MWIAPSTSNRSRQQVETGGSLGFGVQEVVCAVVMDFIWILGLLGLLLSCVECLIQIISTIQHICLSILVV